jgi:DNA end-binding protein Ku
MRRCRRCAGDAQFDQLTGNFAMARALWKGAITFGLVNIPVEVYSAEDRKGFKFSMLDKRDFSPVGYKRYSKKSGKEVAWGDIIKGYEYEKDQYVVLSDEDFKRANVRATQTIDIRAFVPADAIPAEYYETPYYLAPAGRGAAKVYALLRETLRATNRIAVAQVVIRTTNHLAAVVVNGPALMLNTLRYVDELRPASEFELPAEGMKAAGVTAKEIELAKRLVDDMTEDWNPKEFKDTYHDDLLARIDEKIKQGETHQITEPGKEDTGEPRTAQVIDLAELLKQSLGKAGAKKAPERRAAAASAREKTSLRVVPSERGATKTAAKPPAKRKRA